MTVKDAADALRRAAAVRLLCLDVDGTLTDGRLYYLPQGGIARAFNVLDGLGVKRFIAGGGIAALITAAAEEEGGAIRARAADIGIHHIYMGCTDKAAVLQQLLAAESIAAEEAAFMGDDLTDLAPMRQVGFAVAPATAVEEVRAAAHYIPALPAGEGAVREVCELILAARRGGAGG